MNANATGLTNTRLNQFNRRHQFSSSAPADTSRAVSRFSPHRPGRFDLAAAAATASPEQQRSAAEETRRQLESRRTFERELAESGVTVRPGSPEAAQASERRPDDKSADLGNKALAQILYLQSLLGRSGRR
ncbi:hypothetical protein FJT64_000962 [Amphibalanus amphitrite]|uniref:Uncharacterized protein n=1 Tax=Amphibalanus amphitrite TaxID=1232801 RepID=A0A6A4VIT7_AMPAM|nr:hypothetical protein FJT64_000962 [Amphibalanus amphitrite]